IKLSQLPHALCEKFTIMNIVAHQDDDLLFTSPDLLHDVQAGNCIRTIYLTAGDAGTQQLYWLNRERGSEAAYSSMLKSHQPWASRIIKLNSRQFITISTPRHSPQTSLIFLHLPDGNLKGNGFAASNYESLAKLERGK